MILLIVAIALTVWIGTLTLIAGVCRASALGERRLQGERLERERRMLTMGGVVVAAGDGGGEPSASVASARPKLLDAVAGASRQAA